MGAGVVRLYLDTTSHPIGKATASATGTFSKSVTMSGVSAGNHLVIAVGANGSTATAVLKGTAKVTVKPVAAGPQAPITATLVGFQPDETVSVYWGSTSGQLLGTAMATTAGTGTISLIVPAEGAGTYSIVTVGSEGTSTTTPFTVT
jgi:hypothetical protein